MSDFQRIATHGDPPEKVRSALERLALDVLRNLRQNLVLHGLPPAAVNAAAVAASEKMCSGIDADLPRMMADMARTSGDSACSTDLS